jgi:hypothetical protein
VVIVAAVAVTGIVIGRWGIPAEDAATVFNPSANASRSDRFESIAAEQKVAKMEAAEARYSTTGTVTVSDAEGTVDQANVVDRKFAQMDAAEARYSTTVTNETSRADVLVDEANSAAISASLVDRKFASSGRARCRTL